MVANIFDAGLQAIAAFLKATGAMQTAPTHRALGRQAFIDVVSRADRSIDDVAASFDFLLAVTPINAEAAWREFEASRFERAPRASLSTAHPAGGRRKEKAVLDRLRSLRRPGALRPLPAKSSRNSICNCRCFRLEILHRFVEISRALYGPVEPVLLCAARDILAKTETTGSGRGRQEMSDTNVDCLLPRERGAFNDRGLSQTIPRFRSEGRACATTCRPA